MGANPVRTKYSEQKISVIVVASCEHSHLYPSNPILAIKTTYHRSLICSRLEAIFCSNGHNSHFKLALPILSKEPLIAWPTSSGSGVCV